MVEIGRIILLELETKEGDVEVCSGFKTGASISCASEWWVKVVGEAEAKEGEDNEEKPRGAEELETINEISEYYLILKYYCWRVLKDRY